MNDLTTDIALVTGATRGIGQAITRALGQRGATIIGTATTVEGADKITAAIQAAGLKGEGRPLDVRDTTACNALVDAVSKTYGNISILVNNAGITRDNLMLRMKPEEWDDILNTNLTSVYRLSQAVLRGMLKARRGRIINISSVTGVMGNAGQANYAAAKAGMIGFTKSLAREIGSRNVTVNAVAPGFIETDMTQGLNDDIKQTLLKQIALERLGRPEDIAEAVAFLASPAASYITGETLHVNGGLHMA